MKDNNGVVALEPTKKLPSAEQPQTRKSLSFGIFLPLILLCVLITGMIAIFICCHFSVFDKSDKIIFDDVLKSPKKPQEGNTIFFHKANPYFNSENSRVGIFDSLARRLQAYRLHLTPREACAIESAAFNNPDQEVFVLYESPMLWTSNNKLGLAAVLQNISNVNLRSLDAKRFMRNSPFESLIRPMESHKLLRSKIIDLLKFLSLWRYGGTYVDLDTITLQNYKELGSNFAAIDKNNEVLHGNLFSFAPVGIGYHLIKNLVYEITKILRNTCNIDDIPDAETLSSQLLTDLYQKICHTKDLKQMQERLQCFGFRVYGQDQVREVPSDMNMTALQEFQREIDENSSNWYLTYNWENFYVEHNSERVFFGPYITLAEKHCPKVYAYVQLFEKYVYGLSSEDTKEETPEKDESNEID